MGDDDCLDEMPPDQLRRWALNVEYRMRDYSHAAFPDQRADSAFAVTRHLVNYAHCRAEMMGLEQPVNLVAAAYNEPSWKCEQIYRQLPEWGRRVVRKLR